MIMIKSSIKFLTFCTSAEQAIGPYAADSNTTFLYHFDEPAEVGVTANEGIAGYNGITFSGAWAGDETDQPTLTDALGATGASGFGNAVRITQFTGVGVDLDENGGYRLNDANPLSTDRFPDHNEILGESFTLEAMVNLGSLSPGHPQEIISTDSNGGVAVRGFQFRIHQGELSFYLIGSAAGVTTAPIPTTGDHAFVADEWFHAAVSFDGTTLTFYWTRVDASFSSANPIGTAAHTIDLSIGGPLVIGNEGRASGGNPPLGTELSNEGLVGLIDEVRISNVTRGATEFIFSQSAGQKNPEMTGITRNADGSEVEITWRSRPNVSYVVEFSSDLKNWQEIDDGFDSQGESTTLVDTNFTVQSPVRGAYRVRESD